MSLTQSAFEVKATWAQTHVIGAGIPYRNNTQGPDSLVFSAKPSLTTYSEVCLGYLTVAAAANVDIDLRSFTSLLNFTITATKVVILLLRGTGVGAQMVISDGSVTPLTWFLGGTLPTITLHCGTSGCVFAVMDGSPYTIDATHRKLNVANPGSADLTLGVYALVSTL